MKAIKSIYFTNRFWQAMFSIATLFVFGHFFAPIFVITKVLSGILLLLVLIELIILFSSHAIAERIAANKFSNGDNNLVTHHIKNNYSIQIAISVIDEIPEQFQMRNSSYSLKLKPYESYEYKYHLKPVERGLYNFGFINIYCSSKIGFISRRFKAAEHQTVAVYPSFFKLKETEMIAFMRSQATSGLKRIFKIGNNKEFEQIKDYVIGDDYRRLNWKATARMNKLMVNEYQDESSQDVYQLIDMGRSMKMPFNGMTLLDYSINSALALGNIILKKNDKTGLLTYSTKVHSFVKSDNRKSQIHKIMEVLYAQETLFQESNLEAAYTTLRKQTQGRSLVIIYTNYESILSLERQLPILKKLSHQHLVVLVSFINSKLVDIAERPAHNTIETYRKVLAEKIINEKKQFMDKLIRYGIINLRVLPEELNISILNKYLEIKNRGLL